MFETIRNNHKDRQDEIKNKADFLLKEMQIQQHFDKSKARLSYARSGKGGSAEDIDFYKDIAYKKQEKEILDMKAADLEMSKEKYMDDIEYGMHMEAFRGSLEFQLAAMINNNPLLQHPLLQPIVQKLDNQYTGGYITNYIGNLEKKYDNYVEEGVRRNIFTRESFDFTPRILNHRGTKNVQ